MASSIQPRGEGKHQLRVVHKQLPKPFFWTFTGQDSYEQAKAYRDKLEALLAQGVVPQALLAKPAAGADPLLNELISQYEQHSTPAESDLPTLKLLRTETAGLRASDVSYEWAEGFVKALKRREVAPGTIRKRVGSLARVMDWHLKRTTEKGKAMAPNPLRLLPRGYSQYTAAEGNRVDEVRDRRLSADEEGRIRLALSGVKRKDRERPLEVDEDLQLLFDLVLDTGLRLREAYRLRVEQVDLQRGVLRLEGSKATRGARKPRVVPLKPHLRERLRPKLEARQSGLLLHFWDGRKETLTKTTARLSTRFASLFSYADVEDFTEHDLRHEATCRWFELRDARGAWVFSDIEICRIMGWTSTKMALRYASLRGEDLADRLL